MNSNICKTNLLISLLIIISTLLAYQGIFHNGFVGYDDSRYLFENDHIRFGLSIDGILWAFRSSYDANWFPLTLISHMADISIFGSNPLGHHLVNLSLHIANALLLYRLLTTMTGTIWRSAVVAILFALHPLHVESVAWVAERKDLLSTLFFLLAITAYLNYVTKRSLRGYLATVVLFLCGLATKPMVVSLPFVLLLLDVWPLKRLVFEKDNLASGFRIIPILLFEKIPFIIMSAVSCIITIIVQKSGGTISSFTGSTLSENAAHAVINYVSYLRKTFWPTDMAVLYPYVHELVYWQVAASIVLLLIISFLVIWQWKSRPYLTVGWFWYLITLVPVIGFVRIGVHSIADRYTYIPLIGIFIIVTWALADVLERSRHGRLIAITVALLLFPLLGVTTWRQTGYWKDGIALYEHTLKVTHDNWVMHTNLAGALSGAGIYDRAIWHFKEAVRIEPNYAPARQNLGNLLRRLNDIPGAIQTYRTTIEHIPDFTDSYYQLSITLFLTGDKKAAFETCAELEMKDPVLAHSLKKRLTLLNQMASN